MFLKVFLLNCILQISLADCTQAASVNAPEEKKCQKDKCDVMIGGEGAEHTYCSQCSTPTNHLVEGACLATGDSNADKCETPASGVCTSCKDAYFMYKGGCYNSAGGVGVTLCTAATNGKCDTPATGYFIIPGTDGNVADKSHQSVLSCSDTDGVTVEETKKTYQGIKGCAECTLKSSATTATCSKCATGALYTSPEGATSCPATCPEGYFEHTAKSTSIKTCQSCSAPTGGLDPAATGVTGCVKCTYNTKVICEKCGQDKYLKIDGETISCVDAQDCGTGFFMITVEGIKKCVSCGDTTNGGIESCTQCTATASPTRSGAPLVTCLQCNGKKVQPDRKGCIQDCPENSTEASGVCECNSGYTSSADGLSCVVASTGPNLSTGAIAGISVAAVVVVGGLVGFLCWWFVCRGKA
ncbi:Variant-specific surface protein [Giardia duodenalis]|uniref:Variant-specific surface protein n=1 Tax=Giardia intestinalis TaxID=5741 RepID=V6TPR1_GIAIN|nr:Variant-specific surface protein [Giardia intestinalis]